MEAAHGSTHPTYTTQYIVPWFMGAAWIPKFDGDKTKFVEWRAQVEVMLRAQGLNQQQEADFIFGALEGEAKRELQLLRPRERNTSQKILDILQGLYGQSASRAHLRASFFNCKQRPEESVRTFVLRLRELFARWREQDEDEHDGEDLLLDQLMVGLKPGRVKQELSRQMRRNERMTFSEATKEARFLEQESEDGEPAVCSQRVVARSPGGVATTSTGEPPSQIRAEMQAELLKEMRKEIAEQMKVISANLLAELKTQAPMDDPTPKPTGNHVAPMQENWARRRRTDRQQQTYRWDPQGRPICKLCNQVGHLQRHCTQSSNQRQGF